MLMGIYFVVCDCYGVKPLYRDYRNMVKLFKAPFWENRYFFATELPLKLRSVAHFYTTVVNTNPASRPPNGQRTRVFVDKLKGYRTGKDFQRKPKKHVD